MGLYIGTSVSVYTVVIFSLTVHQATWAYGRRLDPDPTRNEQEGSDEGCSDCVWYVNPAIYLV